MFMSDDVVAVSLEYRYGAHCILEQVLQISAALALFWIWCTNKNHAGPLTHCISGGPPFERPTEGGPLRRWPLCGRIPAGPPLGPPPEPLRRP